MFRILALTALSISLISCAGKSTQQDARHPSSERPEVDCRAALCPAIAPPRCKPNEKIARGNEPGCCPRPICVPKNAPDCARVRCLKKAIECGENEEAVDNRAPGACCPQMVCVTKDDDDQDGVTNSEDACPTVSGPVDNEGCPRPAPDCRAVRCDGRKPKCEPGQELVDLREPGACCPNWSCEDEGDSNEEL